MLLRSRMRGSTATTPGTPSGTKRPTKSVEGTTEFYSPPNNANKWTPEASRLHNDGHGCRKIVRQLENLGVYTTRSSVSGRISQV